MPAWRVTVCTYSALPIFSKHTIKLHQTSSLPPRCSAIFEQSEPPTTPICSLLLASLWERVPFIPSRQRMHVFLRVPSVAITMAAARRAKRCHRPCYFICIAHVTHKCILTVKDSLSAFSFLCLLPTPERTRLEYFEALLYNLSYATCTHVFGHVFICLFLISIPTTAPFCK